jgi:rhamnose utilization protein RhaD (predicted bifunctional aldolase and dehydrogenase)
VIITGDEEGTVDDIIWFSRTIGEPHRDLVILAEGNTSMRTAENRMLVKASGSNLATASTDDFVEVDIDVYMEQILGGDASDADVADMMRRATLQGTKRPSVESLLHAVCMQVPGVNAIAHTHPTAVNSLLCSDRARALMEGSMFPDQIVVMGQHQLMVPYVDPGLPLAQVVHGMIGDHIREHGSHPKVIYLLNHGMFALGANAEESIQITTMAVKVARVMLGALSVGSPTYLAAEHADRIDTRPDEEHRRALLANF